MITYTKSTQICLILPFWGPYSTYIRYAVKQFATANVGSLGSNTDIFELSTSFYVHNRLMQVIFSHRIGSVSIIEGKIYLTIIIVWFLSRILRCGSGEQKYEWCAC